ncbi:MAG: Cation-independent mannose-6-phosphate receptor CI-MPR [Phylliscum demangeonii]|nr:MAG: Cation-independent mannose-6-phosphate receptor CI-MPR [Phylliscum demangeonii]
MRVDGAKALVLGGCWLSISSRCAASDDKKTQAAPVAPCTIHSLHTGSFFDLTPISVARPAAGKKKTGKEGRAESWHAKGHDYPANFTLNVCAPAIEDVQHVVGVDRDRWRNISAFYERDGHTYSIGQQSSTLLIRGKKLVLQYTDGSPCGAPPSPSPSPSPSRRTDGDDGHPTTTRRKSALISLLCDRDPLAPKAAVAFVGASPDECAYFFELRSQYACGGVSVAQQTLGPGGVFGVIALIAILVYLVGGCVYQRTVMHARGWRQLPNYGMWAGMASFVKDLFVILTSSCARCLPSRRGYRSLGGAAAAANGNASPARSGRVHRSDDENRLIDQLDEEWDD